jgi:hypothetical protein
MNLQWLDLKFKDQQLVVLSCVLVDEINYGYEDEEGRILKKVNGQDIINLNHLLQILQDAQTGVECEILVNGAGVITFGFDEDIVLVFDAEEVAKKNPQLLKSHKIPAMTNIQSK